MAPLPADDLVAELDPRGVGLSDLELNVVAHVWAHDHATPLDLVAVDDETGTRLAEALGRMVASSVGIVAMKATTIPLRASSRPEKRASDLYDLARLVVASPLPAAEVELLPEPVRSAVLERLHGWFVDDAGRDRTYREVRRFDEPAIDLDDVGDAVEDLVRDARRRGARRPLAAGSGGLGENLRLLRRLLDEPIPVLDECASTVRPELHPGRRPGPDRGGGRPDHLPTCSPSRPTVGSALNVIGFIVGPTSMIVSDGDDHHRRRSAVQPAFARRRLDGWIPMIAAEADRVIDERLAPRWIGARRWTSTRWARTWCSPSP